MIGAAIMKSGMARVKIVGFLAMGIGLGVLLIKWFELRCGPVSVHQSMAVGYALVGVGYVFVHVLGGRGPHDNPSQQTGTGSLGALHNKHCK